MHLNFAFCLDFSFSNKFGSYCSFTGTGKSYNCSIECEYEPLSKCGSQRHNSNKNLNIRNATTYRKMWVNNFNDFTCYSKKWFRISDNHSNFILPERKKTFPFLASTVWHDESHRFPFTPHVEFVQGWREDLIWELGVLQCIVNSLLYLMLSVLIMLAQNAFNLGKRLTPQFLLHYLSIFTN